MSCILRSSKVTLVLLKMTRLAVLGAAGTVCLLASVTRACLTVAQSQAWLNTVHFTRVPQYVASIFTIVFF